MTATAAKTRAPRSGSKTVKTSKLDQARALREARIASGDVIALETYGPPAPIALEAYGPPAPDALTQDDADLLAQWAEQDALALLPMDADPMGEADATDAGADPVIVPAAVVPDLGSISPEDAANLSATLRMEYLRQHMLEGGDFAIHILGIDRTRPETIALEVSRKLGVPCLITTSAGTPLMTVNAKAHGLKLQTQAREAAKVQKTAKAATAAPKAPRTPTAAQAGMISVAARPEGATNKELCEATGRANAPWKLDLSGCQKYGYSLRVAPGADGKTRYFLDAVAAPEAIAQDAAPAEAEAAMA